MLRGLRIMAVSGMQDPLGMAIPLSQAMDIARHDGPRIAATALSVKHVTCRTFLPWSHDSSKRGGWDLLRWDLLIQRSPQCLVNLDSHFLYLFWVFACRLPSRSFIKIRSIHIKHFSVNERPTDKCSRPTKKLLAVSLLRPSSFWNSCIVLSLFWVDSGWLFRRFFYILIR